LAWCKSAVRYAPINPRSQGQERSLRSGTAKAAVPPVEMTKIAERRTKSNFDEVGFSKKRIEDA